MPTTGGPKLGERSAQRGGETITLTAFTCGWFFQPVSFYLGGDDSTLLRSPMCAFLIEHPEGLVLFDTGPSFETHALYDPSRTALEQGFEFPMGTDIAARLSDIGVDPGDIRWVVNSHLHTDHCGGNALIPNATVILQKREIEAAERAALDAPDSRARMLYVASLYETGQEILAIDGEYDLFGDGTVTLMPTFGHTPGHQSLRVSLPSGDVILAGDCCNLERSLDELRVSPLDSDQEQALATLTMLDEERRRGVRVFPGHDGHFWETIPHDTPLT